METQPASEWVKRYADFVPAGSLVLDLACGSGRHTRLFSSLGYPVLAVDRDISRVPEKLQVPDVELHTADLESDEGWPLAGRTFGGIVVTNYLHRPLFPHLLDSLQKGGVLIYETFAVGNEKYGKPSRPDFLLKPGELLEVVRGRLQVLAYEHGEVEHPRPAVVQRICALNAP